MNCNDFKERIADFAGGEPIPEPMQRHLSTCADCAAELRSARRALDAVTPRSVVEPSPDFAARILAAARTTPFRLSPRRRILRWVGSVAAAAAVVAVAVTFSLRTPAYAARKYFGNAVAAMSDLRTFRMELRVRTRPFENFSYTDPTLDFVPHTVTVEYGDTLRWRVEKPGRIVVNDGRTTRMWLPEAGQGFFAPTGGFNAVEELGILLDPRLLMLSEQRLAAHTKGANYEVDEEGSTVRLRVVMPAQGNFRQSDYALNSSISESNTLREYRFDKASGRLTEARITALLPGGDRVVLVESDRIAYDEPVDRAALTAVPDGIEWIDLSVSPSGSHLTGISAREAATRILKAMNSWDETLLDEAFYFYGSQIRETLKSVYKGATILSVDKPVRSGDYAGVFVPCEILRADGKTDRLMMALRNDNPEKSWVVDGGF